jgi:hypothetical protein
MAFSLKSLFRGRGEAPPALRFNGWTLGGHGADVFEKSAEALELERMNPLRGVDEWRLGQIFDDARDGVYADLAWLYNEIEGVEPALMACCETRESAAGELGWIVRTADPDRTRGFDKGLADEQRAALLAEFGAVGDDLPELAGHMTTAFFRGAAHALPLWNADGSLAGFKPLDLWNFAFDRGSGIWYWNADASRDEGTFQPVPPGETVSLAVSSSRHVDHAALPIFIRAALGAKRYGVWLDRFGIPPVGVIMPPNAERGEQGAYMDLARKFARGGSGVLPNGSQVTYGTEARSVCPFPEFIRFQQQQIYAIGMGRVQSGENQGDNLGGNAAGVVDSALRRIVRRDARRIARAVNDCVTRKVLARLFPGRPMLAQFAWDTEAKRTGREALEDAGLARNAGLAIDRGQLEEMTGYTLSDAPQPANPGGFGGFGPSLNSRTPDYGVAKPLQNARRAGEATSVPPEAETRLDAILDDFSAKLAVEMQDEMFSAAAKALGEADENLNSGHPYTKCPGCGKFMSPSGACGHCNFVEDDDRLIARGKRAIERALSGHKRDVPEAMYRKGVGTIDFDLGWPGKGPGQEHGSGMLKMEGKHLRELAAAPETIVKGEIVKLEDRANPGHEDPDSIAVIRGSNIAILNRKPGKDRWMLFTHFTSDTGARKRIEASKKLEAPTGKGR